MNMEQFYGYILGLLGIIPSLLGIILSLLGIWLTLKIYLVVNKPKFKIVYDKGWYCGFDQKLKIKSVGMIKDKTVFLKFGKPEAMTPFLTDLVGISNPDNLSYCVGINRDMLGFLKTRVTKDGAYYDWLQLMNDDISLHIEYKDPVLRFKTRKENIPLVLVQKEIKEELTNLHKVTD